MQKVDVASITDAFLHAVAEIEQMAIPQKEKTRRFQAAATKVRNALFYDKRKFGDQRLSAMAKKASKTLLTQYPAYQDWLHKLAEAQTADEIEAITQQLIEDATDQADTAAIADFSQLKRTYQPRLAISTYRKYVTNLRNQLRDRNLRHHSLPTVVERYRQRFPAYHALLDALLAADAHTAGLKRLHLLNAATERQDPEAFAAFNKIKTDHEACRHLFVGHMEKMALEQEQAEALHYRKTHTIKINPDSIIKLINHLLTTPTKHHGLVFDYARLAIGIALATGRRAVEVIYTGQFQLIDEHTLYFTGQAKKRAGTEGDTPTKLTIPTLVPAPLVVASMQQLRALEPMLDLQARMAQEPNERLSRALVNKVTSINLNVKIKQLMGETFTFKDTRAMYARMAYAQFFNTHYWQNIDEDEFFRRLLGHQDYETVKAYRCIQLDSAGLDFSPTIITRHVDETLLTAFKTLDVSGAGRGVQKLHQFVCFVVENAPGTQFNQTMLNKKAGQVLQFMQLQNIVIPEHFQGIQQFSRPVTQRYLQLAHDLLETYHRTCTDTDEE
ncbi:MAG: Vibrio virus [Pseudomonadota bacterium]|jgi:hypothetical protein